MASNRASGAGLGPEFVDDPTDEDYARAAREALRDKNLRLAMEQVAAAIALRPHHEPHLRLLDDVARAAPGPLVLVELPRVGAFYGMLAARARVLARVDRIEEAVDAALQAATFEPSASFVSWAIEWVKRPKSARAIDPVSLASRVVALTRAVSSRGVLDRGSTANLEAALAVATAVAAQHPPSVELTVARSRALRMLGRYDEAKAQLGSFKEDSRWEIAVEWAGIHRDLGDVGARIEWLHRAREARPSETTTHLDLGDAHLDDGALTDAAASYDQALALDPSSGFATLGAAYARALADGSTAIGVRLGGQRSPSQDERARAIDADLSAYATRLADPIDPVIAVIRSTAARAASSGDGAPLRVRARADRPLAPSARVAFAFVLAEARREGTLRIDHDETPARFGPLWRDDLSRAEPAHASPPPSVIERAREIAQIPFDLQVWSDRALSLAASATDEESATFERAAAFVPAPPSGMDAVRWTHGFQVAAMLLCAGAKAPADVRLARLTALSAGQDDWTSAAALVGLRALARTDPALSKAILDVVTPLVPARDAPLAPGSLALALLGADLAEGPARRDFLRLRMRVRFEIG